MIKTIAHVSSTISSFSECQYRIQNNMRTILSCALLEIACGSIYIVFTTDLRIFRTKQNRLLSYACIIIDMYPLIFLEIRASDATPSSLKENITINHLMWLRHRLTKPLTLNNSLYAILRSLVSLFLSLLPNGCA